MSAPQGMNAPTSFSTRRRIGALRLAARNIPISPPMEVPTQSIMGGGGPPRSRSSQVPAAGAATPASNAAPSAREGEKLDSDLFSIQSLSPAPADSKNTTPQSRAD